MRQSLCGHRECEKLGVLTALEQFQYSAGAGGVRASWTFWASWRGESRVSRGVDRRGREEGKTFISKCSVAIKMTPDIGYFMLNKLMMSSKWY